MFEEGRITNKKKRKEEETVITNTIPNTVPNTPMVVRPINAMPPYPHFQPHHTSPYSIFGSPAVNLFFSPFFYPWQMMPHVFPFSNPSIQSKANTSRPSSPEKQPTPPPAQSSPVQIEGDAGSLLRDYINWQIKRHPSQHQALDTAYNKLQLELYDLQDIRRFQDVDYNIMCIPLGLGKRLSREVKLFRMKYQHRGTLERQQTHVYTQPDMPVQRPFDHLLPLLIMQQGTNHWQFKKRRI